MRRLSIDWMPGIVWCRIFGVGLHVRDLRRWPPMFSERSGRRRILKIGRIAIKVLWPSDFKPSIVFKKFDVKEASFVSLPARRPPETTV